MSKRNNNYAAMGRDKQTDYALGKLEVHAERKLQRRKFAFAKKKHGAHFAERFEFECQLYLGEKKFPRKMMFTAFGRAEANKMFEDKFAATIINGETTHSLSSWRWVDVKAVRTARQDCIGGKVKILMLKKESEKPSSHESNSVQKF